MRRAGWDNLTFRLGDDMLVRLPSAAEYALAVEKEQQWLPVLAAQLPVPIPFPLGLGVPGAGFGFPWSIYNWLAGEPRRSQQTGTLAAVIDFGTCGVGDPSCDLAIAWTLLTPSSREHFRGRLDVDDATWARGRGWALWTSLRDLAGTAIGTTERSEAQHVVDAIVEDFTSTD